MENQVFACRSDCNDNYSSDSMEQNCNVLQRESSET